MNFQVFAKALHEVGIKRGDLLFIHSDIRPFGIPEGRGSRKEILQFYLDAFQAAVGPEGTLAVPAFFYEYARYGKTFDSANAPVSQSLGVFSSYINALNHRVRSLNPLQSIAAIGPQAQYLCGNSLMGYGIASPWHRLRLLQGKLLFVGVTLQPMTFVHHIEQQYGVAHLYQKLYDIPILCSGEKVEGHPISSVRYLDYEITYDLSFFQEELKKRSQLFCSQVGKGSIYLVSAEEAFQTGIELLSKNCYCFLRKPPAFIPGKIPLDGITSSRA